MARPETAAWLSRYVPAPPTTPACSGFNRSPGLLSQAPQAPTHPPTHLTDTSRSGRTCDPLKRDQIFLSFLHHSPCKSPPSAMDTAVLLTVSTYLIWAFEVILTAAALAAVYRQKAKNNWCVALGLAIKDYASLRISNTMQDATNAGIKTGAASCYLLATLLAAGGTSTAIFSPSTDVAPTIFEAVTPWVAYNWDSAASPTTDRPQIVFTLPGEERQRREIVWQATPPTNAMENLSTTEKQFLVKDNTMIHQDISMKTDLQTTYNLTGEKSSTDRQKIDQENLDSLDQQKGKGFPVDTHTDLAQQKDLQEDGKKLDLGNETKLTEGEEALLKDYLELDLEKNNITIEDQDNHTAYTGFTFYPDLDLATLSLSMFRAGYQYIFESPAANLTTSTQEVNISSKADQSQTQPTMEPASLSPKDLTPDKRDSLSTKNILLALAVFAAVLLAVGIFCGFSLACALLQACAKKPEAQLTTTQAEPNNQLEMTTI